MIAEEFDYRLAPVDVAALLRARSSLACLDSVLVSESMGRYSYVMASPSVVLIGGCDADGKLWTTVRAGSAGDAKAQVQKFNCDPLEICNLALDGAAEDALGAANSDLPPFRGGWAGYIGYDYGAALHGVKASDSARPAIPGMRLCWYDWVLAWDHIGERAWIVVRGSQPDLASLQHAASELQSGRTIKVRRAATRQIALLAEVRRDLAQAARCAEAVSLASERRSAAAVRDLRSNFSRDDYMRAVQSVCELILAGDIFQANISQKFSAAQRVDPWQLYGRLRDATRASYAAYLQFDGAAILSSSPEMFLSVSADGAVESRPIKGTRPRGSTAADDTRLAQELGSSEKDRSENLMIVDLLRNDLSRVCEPGTVFVPELFHLERLATVQHLVSTVRGQLCRGKTASDLLRACFPGGSVTGAPKTRAMQIIAAIEGTGRGVYCGSIGYFAADGGALFNIAIRTITLAEGIATFSAGGGIVLDSDPAAEYEETLTKARGMLSALGRGTGAATTY